MNWHRELFNELLSHFGYSAKQVSAWSGVHESRLSRFRKGKLDLEAGEFFSLLESMPEEAQDYFWAQKKLQERSLEKMVSVMNDAQLSQLLVMIAGNLSREPESAGMLLSAN
jgi:predicted transcriptional regulator